jgi:transcriptional regulator with XRE-family HTH domain
VRLEGRVWKEGKHWLVEVPLLDVMTQGRTRDEAQAMIADAIEALVGEESFKVEVFALPGDALGIGASDTGRLTALMLRRQREMHGLTLAEAAKRMGQSSSNAYARYEQGASVPTVTKLTELLVALSPGDDFVLVRRKRRVGSTLDSLLKKDGTLGKVTATAAKRVAAWQGKAPAREVKKTAARKTSAVAARRHDPPRS